MELIEIKITQIIGRKMKRKILFIFLITLSSVLFYNCSDVQDDIAPPTVVVGVHPDGFDKVNSANFHSFTLKANNWDLTQCQKCHGADYSGGVTGVSCLTCHTESAGPEACNTCHGDFADENRIAPPNDLEGNSATTFKGVGAHSVHVYDSATSLGIGCYECHPKEVGNGDDYVKAHIDGLPAEIQFGTFASSGTGSPEYTADLTCKNTYCHGDFAFQKSDADPDHAWIYTGSEITGENFSPKWTQVDGTQAACGTCHLLPPRGHFFEGQDPEAQTCGLVNCHESVYNEDGTLNPYLHINGEKNFK